MPKYVDEPGLTRFYDNIADRPVYTFDTVAEMQAATYLEDGMTCHTNGFYSAGDGGGAWFVVASSSSGLLPVTLTGGVYANRLVQGDSYNALSLGFKGDDATDNKAVMDSVTAYCASSGYQYLEVFFPSGIYRFSPTTIATHNLAIRGCGNYSGMTLVQVGNDPYGTGYFEAGSTIFAPVSDQAFILQVGGIYSADRIDNSSVYGNNRVEDICFTSIKSSVTSSTASKMYQMSDACLRVCNQYMGTFRNLHFCVVLGTGIKQVYGYENNFDGLMFRCITPASANDDGAFVLTRSPIYSDSSVYSISACHYGYMWFEFCYGSLIQVVNTGVSDCCFDGFSYEDGYQSGFNTTAAEYTSGSYSTVPLVSLKNDIAAESRVNITFGQVSLNYMSRFVFTSALDSMQYVHDVVLSAKDFDGICNATFASVQASYLSNPFVYFEGHDSKVSGFCQFAINGMSRGPFGAVYERSLYDYLRGYATCVSFDGIQTTRATDYRPSFDGFDCSDIYLAQSAMVTDSDGKTNRPNMVCGANPSLLFYVKSHAMLNLNIPSDIWSATSNVNMFQFVKPCIGDKFMCIVYIPTDDRTDAPVVDAYAANGTAKGLTPIISRVKTGVYRITIDTSAITPSHLICVGNDQANTTENLLLEWAWA